MPADTAELPLMWALTALTAVSGIIDAVCYLGLGHVFTANMTGNIVVLGFAAAGAPGFSATASLTSLVVFLLGAVIGGRLAAAISSVTRLLITTMFAEAITVAGAAVIAFTAATVASGWARYTVIALLALPMGARNAVVRHLSIRDMTTTVLTLTLTGLAADSTLAGGGNPRAARRVFAVAAMLAGAVAGAAAFLHESAGLALLIAAVITAAAAISYRLSAGRRAASA